MNTIIHSEFQLRSTLEYAASKGAFSEENYSVSMNDEANAFHFILLQNDPKMSFLHEENHQRAYQIREPLSEREPLVSTLFEGETLDEGNLLFQGFENVSPLPCSTPPALAPESIRLLPKTRGISQPVTHLETQHASNNTVETTNNAQADSKKENFWVEASPEVSDVNATVVTKSRASNVSEIEWMAFETNTLPLKGNVLENEFSVEKAPDRTQLGEKGDTDLAAFPQRQVTQKADNEGSAHLPKLVAGAFNAQNTVEFANKTKAVRLDEKTDIKNALGETTQRALSQNVRRVNEFESINLPTYPPSPTPDQKVPGTQVDPTHPRPAQPIRTDDKTASTPVVSTIFQTALNEKNYGQVNPAFTSLGPQETGREEAIKMDSLVQDEDAPIVTSPSAPVAKAIEHFTSAISKSSLLVQPIETALDFYAINSADSIGDLGIEAVRTSLQQPTPFVVRQSSQNDIARSIAQQITAVQPIDSSNQIELALSPDELGRVKLTFTPAEGAINVSIVAERPETLELMKRNIDTLAQEFLGLGYEQASFSFSQSNTGRDGESNPQHNSPKHILVDPKAEDEKQITPLTLHFSQSESVDIRI